RIAVLFGGSENAVNALNLGLKLSMASGVDMTIFTLKEKEEAHYRKIVKKRLPEGLGEQAEKDWLFFDRPAFEEMLYAIPHDALVVMGAYGHGPIKDVLFGSKLEKIQSTIGNPLLVIGPESRVELRP
ncbi:MAG TPA: universal stress protein UspA, partial [Desulfobacteraceae bacterium]|nr:universal stress protein UspA [Desulfobacteraceae bacterium]